MSQERSEQNREVAAQREVARIALAAVDGFALAGSGAIREHGVIERPTEDVDLFTDSQDVKVFSTAVDQVTAQLRGSGFQVEQTRRAPQFARLHVATSDGLHLDVDLGVDWRQEDPVQLDVGPVLSLADAVGSKVSTIYSRGEARDYLDLDAIRSSRLFSDEQLVTAAAARDGGFEVGMFAQQLAGVRWLTPPEVSPYGVTAEQLEGIKSRCMQWAADLQQKPARGSDPEAAADLSGDELRGLIERRQAGFPIPPTEATRRPPGPKARPAQHHQKDQDRGIEL